ncbi:unnamed protein product [Polarella glacialis]|uniref:Uncharacterized protein n=1 Tax=Polarella glacialis TaxID=89957 RepID=A0A813J048_POLGL|nr:unnamed protein product [Polarella glacialis]CAE8658536.1 unnamed protein product [Polarella glacialis]CAE8661030.1 unnamed protein product [Polarella glacialis]
MADGPGLPQERYKLCNVVCKPRNGWTLDSFCKGNYNAVCLKSWRLGYRENRCVSPYVEFKERVMMETATVVDSVVVTRGKPNKPQMDNATRSFCFKRCDDTFDKEKDWTAAEVWDVCRHHMDS